MMLANGFFVPFHSYKGYIQGLQIRRKSDENVLIEKMEFMRKTLYIPLGSKIKIHIN